MLPSVICCVDWNQSQDIEDNWFMALSGVALLTGELIFLDLLLLGKKTGLVGLADHELQRI